MDNYLINGMVLLGYFRKVVTFAKNKFNILYNFFEFYKFKEEAADIDSRLIY